MLPRFNTTSYGKHLLENLVPQLWSKLDATIRNAASINAFKKVVRIRKQDFDALVTNNCKIVYYAHLSCLNIFKQSSFVVGICRFLVER